MGVLEGPVSNEIGGRHSQKASSPLARAMADPDGATARVPCVYVSQLQSVVERVCCTIR